MYTFFVSHIISETNVGVMEVEFELRTNNFSFFFFFEGGGVENGWLVGWLVGWLFYGVSTLFESFNAELSHFYVSIVFLLTHS